MLSRKKKKKEINYFFSLLGIVQTFLQGLAAPECELWGICSGVMLQRGDHNGGGVPNPQIPTLSLPSCSRNLENSLPEHPMGSQEG